MKERPILFSAPMVRALLAGTKVQTRRVVKPRKDRDIGCDLAPHELAGEVNGGEYRNAYCAPGDRLWVRETWAEHSAGGFMYAASWSAHALIGHPKWRPSIHMPRAASRITLEVTDVRVERLQDISEADALAEGIDMQPRLAGYSKDAGCKWEPANPIEVFCNLWESIKGPGSWDANPWVWVVEFKRC
jgi:hypothetical protein